MTQPIRVLIVDDHPLYRQGLRQVIESDARFALAGEAASGAEALRLIETQQPALIVLDVGLPDMTGLEVAAQIKQRGWQVAIVVLTMLKDEVAFNKAMAIGVQGYVLKENAVTEIIACMAAVAAGTAYISPSLSGFLLRRHERATALSAHQPGLADLTMAERRILKRVADKKSTKDIAAELNVSPRTVETHRANICSKLDLKGNNSLWRFAWENRDLLADLQ